MDWLSAYPEHLRPVLRPLWQHYAGAGPATALNKTQPMNCQVLMLFTEPGDPTKMAYRESRPRAKYHFCRRLQASSTTSPRSTSRVSAGAADLPGQLLRRNRGRSDALDFNPPTSPRCRAGRDATTSTTPTREDKRTLSAGAPRPPATERRAKRQGDTICRPSPPAEFAAKGHGGQLSAPLLYIGWEGPQMFCAPFVPAAAADDEVWRLSTALAPAWRRPPDFAQDRLGQADDGSKSGQALHARHGQDPGRQRPGQRA